MSIAIYKPNKSNTGCACSFNMSRDGVIFLNLVKQHSWDASNNTGSFKENAKHPSNSTNIKINIFEAGAIIAAIDTYGEASFYHKFDDTTAQIKFSTWVKNQKDIDAAQSSTQAIPPPKYAFGLSVNRNATDHFKLPIEIGEAIAIKHFLSFAINTNIRNAQLAKEKNSPAQ